MSKEKHSEGPPSPEAECDALRQELSAVRAALEDTCSRLEDALPAVNLVAELRKREVELNGQLLKFRDWIESPDSERQELVEENERMAAEIEERHGAERKLRDRIGGLEADVDRLCRELRQANEKVRGLFVYIRAAEGGE